MPKPKRPVLSPLDRRLREWCERGLIGSRFVRIDFELGSFYAVGCEGDKRNFRVLLNSSEGHSPAAAIRAMLDGQKEKGK